MATATSWHEPGVTAAPDLPPQGAGIESAVWTRRDGPSQHRTAWAARAGADKPGVPPG